MNLTAAPALCRFLGPHQGQARLRAEVLRNDAVVTTAVLGRRWGKTIGAAELCLEAAIHEPVSIGWFCDKPPRVRLAWRELAEPIVWKDKTIAPRVDPAFVARQRETDHLFEMRNGSRIQIHSCEESDPGLGEGYDLVVFDEAARIRRSIFFEVILPTLMDRGGRAVLITTPRGKRGRGGWVYDCWKLGERKEPGYYNLTGPSTDNPNPHIQAWVQWYEKNMPPAFYEQEILARFLEDGVSVLNFVPCCTQGGSADKPIQLPYFEPKPDHERCIMGLDYAQHPDWTVAWVIGRKSLRTYAVDRFNGMKYEYLSERAAKVARRYGAAVYYDRTGVGRAAGETLEKFCRSAADDTGVPVPVQGITIANENKQDMITALQTETQQQTLTMPYIAEAVSEADDFEKETLPSGRTKFSAPEGSHDDMVMALALALHGKRNIVQGGLV